MGKGGSHPVATVTPTRKDIAATPEELGKLIGLMASALLRFKLSEPSVRGLQTNPCFVDDLVVLINSYATQPLAFVLEVPPWPASSLKYPHGELLVFRTYQAPLLEEAVRQLDDMGYALAGGDRCESLAKSGILRSACERTCHLIGANLPYQLYVSHEDSVFFNWVGTDPSVGVSPQTFFLVTKK